MSAEVDRPGQQPAGPQHLAVRRSDAGPFEGDTVTLVHGFAQTGGCFGPFGEALERSHPVLRVDQPGHAGSLRHREADLGEGARLLHATVGRSILVGYSMGARLCLHAALEFPDEVTAMVLIGGTAGLADDGERAQRRRADTALAAHLEHVGLDTFLEEWLALPMFSGLPRWARFDEERRANTVEGLSASLRRAGTGAMTPLWDRLGEIRCPVLCVTGGHDERYGSYADEMVASLGGPALHRVVPAAGHAAHLEHPAQSAAAVLEFLAELRS